MGVFSASQETGRIVASEKDKIYLPRRWKFDGSKRLVLWAHGAGADYKVGPTERTLMRLLDAPWIAADLGGTDTWGNNTSVKTRGDTIWTYAKANLGVATDKYVIWGGSMGTLTHLLRVLYDPTHIAAMAGALAIVDPEQVRTAVGSPYKTAIQNALTGGVDTTVDNAYRPNQNNASYISNAVPGKLWISDTDTVGDPTLAQNFADAIGWQRASLGSVGHSYLGIDTDAVAAFLEPYVTP